MFKLNCLQVFGLTNGLDPERSSFLSLFLSSLYFVLSLPLHILKMLLKVSRTPAPESWLSNLGTEPPSYSALDKEAFVTVCVI